MNKKIIAFLIALSTIAAASINCYVSDNDKRRNYKAAPGLEKRAERRAARRENRRKSAESNSGVAQTDPYGSSFQSDRTYVDQTNRNMGNR